MERFDMEVRPDRELKSYHLRTAEDNGKACSTCRHAVMQIDWYDLPYWSCSSFYVGIDALRNPDETICDAWEENQ